MPKLAKEMGALEVSRLAAPGLHFVGAVPGLALHVTKTGARSWVFRVVIAGKRREMGLGNYPSVTLAKARENARDARDLIRKGVDPIERQQAAQSAMRAAIAAALTFKECAGKYIEAHEAGWKNIKHAQQWRNTLEQHAYPHMGSLLVRDVGLPHVMAALEPIWRTKTETASRLRGRIELVLDWANARGYRDGLNPARWRGHLDKLLPAPGKVQRGEHHPALPVAEVGAFMVRLRAAEGMGARALEFAILTAARSGEVRGASWAEIELEAKIWTVPADRIKAGKEHRIPLSDAALALLAAMAALPKLAEAADLVFPAPRGGMLSDMTLSAVLRRMNVAAVPHGFRSTFRDWAAERTSYPNEVCEMALAHAIGDKVEAAYRRGDLFEKRRRLMAEWAEFLARTERPGQVIPFKAA
jgi:integrase